MKYMVCVRTADGKTERVTVEAENQYFAAQKARELFPGSTIENGYRPLELHEVDEFERKLRGD